MRLILKGLAALTVLTMLASNAYAIDPMTRQVIVGWTKCMAEKYHVDPAFALAVFNVESRKGNQEFRIGRVGKYYLPAGIHRDFLKRWPIDDLCTNIEVGCKALRGSQERVLRRYNQEYCPAYGRAVQAATKAYKKENKDECHP